MGGGRVFLTLSAIFKTNTVSSGISCASTQTQSETAHSLLASTQSLRLLKIEYSIHCPLPYSLPCMNPSPIYPYDWKGLVQL